MARLVVCLDGTWNTRDSTTNVWRIHTLVEPTDGDGQPQLKYYDQGVGTRWYDRATGGAFGVGMYTNLREAYNWISENYRPGYEIFLFGFSRGAATALSLANLIDRCGIVDPASSATFEDAYRLYAMPGLSRTTPASRNFRALNATAPDAAPLRFLGLFDTVASLYLRDVSGEQVHVLTIPTSAKFVAHAIAIDEERRLFQSVEFPEAPREGELHERWFSGAHANVGGGYAYDPVAVLPLTWILTLAKAQGLLVRGIPSVPLSEALSVREQRSHEEFAFGLPALFGSLFRKERRIGRHTAGSATETVDASAIARYLKYPTYRRTSRPLARVMNCLQMHAHGDIDVRNL